MTYQQWALYILIPLSPSFSLFWLLVAINKHSIWQQTTVALCDARKGLLRQIHWHCIQRGEREDSSVVLFVPIIFPSLFESVSSESNVFASLQKRSIFLSLSFSLLLSLYPLYSILWICAVEVYASPTLGFHLGTRLDALAKINFAVFKTNSFTCTKIVLYACAMLSKKKYILLFCCLPAFGSVTSVSRAFVRFADFSASPMHSIPLRG